jgi:predicted nucleotidyltransferase
VVDTAAAEAGVVEVLGAEVGAEGLAASAAVVCPVVAELAGAGEGEAMVHEEIVKEFVDKLRGAAGTNLVSVILYGSAAEGEFHPEYSDLNLLSVLRDASFASLAKIAEVTEWWRSKKHHPPLVLTPEELKTTADVFSIEFVDMKQRYRVLWGDDVLKSLDIPMHLHRSQLEYELREKLFLLRQHVVLVGTNEKLLWEVMLQSLSSFTTLLRHALIELGKPERQHSLDSVKELGSRLNFDSSAFVQLIEVRAKKIDRKQLQAVDIAGKYLSAIEKVAAAVDTMQSSSANS